MSGYVVYLIYNIVNMKKILSLLSSMKFGIILLVLIGILCVVATVAELSSIYASWYFIALFALLALNLFFCSVIRVKNIPAWKKGLLNQAKKETVNLQVDDAEKWLKRHGFRKCGDAYIKNSFGLYGTFFTHLAMLLLTVAAACIFAFSVSTDYVIPVGTTEVLEDGTAVTVKNFSMEDADENVEYKSSLIIEMTDGSVKECEVLVNYPVSFGRYKLYQQNYVYSAPIGIRVGTGAEEVVRLDEPAFISLDDTNGIYYASLFTNVVEEGDEIKVTSSSELINPAYEINIIQGENIEARLAFPGSSIEIGGVTYKFYEPEVNPGLRIKEQPEWAMVMLYISFVMMIAGIYGCFFSVAEAADIKKNGISFVSRKNSEQRLALYLSEIESIKEKEIN